MIRYLLLLVLLTTTLVAQENPFNDTPSFESDDSISWAGEGGEFQGIQNFCQFNGNYERIFFSHFSDPPFTEDKIAYGEGIALMSYTRFLSETTAINGGFGYNHTNLHWANNPFFEQKDYDAISFNLNGFTSFWNQGIILKGGASANIDTREWGLSDYTYYMLTGWARFAWRTCALGEIGFNLGATGRAGLGQGFITPIVGVDFGLAQDIKVNLIFPIDMAILYKVTEHWSFAVTGRIWNTKRRWGVDEPVPRGYWEYKNQGVDFGIQYEWDPIAAFNLHVGTTCGKGRVRISNAQDTRIGEFNYNSAPYVGGELWFRF